MKQEISAELSLYAQQKAELILSNLEELNRSWVMHDVPRIHSYGRVPGEEEIRLWSVPRNTGEFLKFLVTAKSATTILEIGTSAGYSAIWLALGAIQTLGHVYTIDIFEPKVELARKHIGDADLDDWITILPGEARERTAEWQKEIDLLFLDADKENYLEYFRNLLPYLKSGALIVADNAVDYGFLMTDYINEVTNNDAVESYLLNVDNGLMLTVKK